MSTNSFTGSRPFVPRGGRQPHYFQRSNASYVFPIPFDPVCCPILTEAPSSVDDAEFEALLLTHIEKLTPGVDEQQAVAALVTKISKIIESLSLTPGKFSCAHVEKLNLVGSFKKDTMLAGHCSADMVVTMRDRPTSEVAEEFGKFVESEFSAAEKTVDYDEAAEITSQPYGFDFHHLGACVRIILTSSQYRFKQEVGSTFINSNHQTVAISAIRHARWFEENAIHANIKALVRIIKDLRRRFAGFEHLTPWHIDLLAFFCVAQSPTNQLLSIPSAFRRMLQVLSAGLFLAGSCGFIDPCESHGRRVHTSLNFAEQDVLCCVAQTMLRVVMHNKYSCIFSTFQPSHIDAAQLAEIANNIPGMHIRSSVLVHADANGVLEENEKPAISQSNQDDMESEVLEKVIDLESKTS